MLGIRMNFQKARQPFVVQNGVLAESSRIFALAIGSLEGEDLHDAGVLDSNQTSCFLFMLSRDGSSLHRKCEFCCEFGL